jgi:uncharacterized protein (TIGR03083 family)
MNRDEVWGTIDEQRARLADLFDELSADEWATPSLCHGWRVRDVAAHLTLAQIGAAPAAMAFLRAGGSFDRMIRDTALRQARLPVREYGQRLRAMLGSRRKAPGVSDLEPLMDVLVHSQDIVLPLGRSWPLPVAAAEAATQRAWTMGRPFHATRRLTGLRLEATDCSWAAGEGLVARGRVTALLMLVTGRSAGLAQLSGPGADRLRAGLPSPAP